MDIDLLSKMVKELILDNDKVVLPGLGSFVAEVVPSTFSDKGYTINPPYRKLYFRAKPDEGSALAEFYSSSNGVNMEIADKVIRDFVSELKGVLFARKMIVFPGLGRLRATKENAVFFIADEDLDIYPEGFALEPISLKTHVETREEVAVVMDELKQIVQEPAPIVDQVTVIEETPVPEETPVAEEVPVAEEAPVVEKVTEAEPGDVVEEPVVIEPEKIEETVEETVEPEPVVEVTSESVAPKKTSFWKILGRTLLIAVITAVVALAAYLLIARFMPEVLDNVLYSPEELEIINKSIC